MYKIKIQSVAKSIPENFEVELPDFTILTGVNGSGKTHFLEAISLQSVIISNSDKGLSKIKYVEFNGFNIRHIEQTPSPNNMKEYALFHDYLKLKHSVGDSQLEKIFQNQNHPGHRLIRSVWEASGKPILKLSPQDFEKFYPFQPVSNLDIFSENLQQTFLTYLHRYDENKYAKYRKEEFNEDTYFISDGEFRRVYGLPPWEIINNLLDTAKIRFRITHPTLYDTRNTGFRLEIIDKLTNAKLSFADLSSGERVIISMYLALYNLNYDIEIPEVLLMDEPDASLHPTMTKQLLDVIESEFVSKRGIKVIMTTHSPTTVAIAPEESIYVMHLPNSEPRIEKIFKDKALRTLTSGLSFLSVNYENRKQVFVESKYDAQIYDEIYKLLSPNLDSNISLSFISSGSDGSGSCEQVKEIVKSLVSNGNNSVFGIIDWDEKNENNDHVKTIGIGERYTIENFIFDPILMSIFLIRERFIDPTSLGLERNVAHYDFKGFNNVKVQQISDKFIESVSNSEQDNSIKTEVKYVNDIQITIPTWYLRINKDELKDLLMKSFKPLNRYDKDGMNKIKFEIVGKALRDVPEFIPSNYLTIFKAIQNHPE